MTERNNLKKLRKERNLTLRELAKLTNISFGYLGELENGKKRLNAETMDKLAKFYNVSYDYLLGRTKTKLISNNYSEEQVNQVLESDKFKDELENKVISLIQKLDKPKLETLESLIQILINANNNDKKEGV
jgi:transcriptional regulator with XRE-family HTH domain